MTERPVPEYADIGKTPEAPYLEVIDLDTNEVISKTMRIYACYPKDGYILVVQKFGETDDDNEYRRVEGNFAMRWMTDD